MKIKPLPVTDKVLFLRYAVPCGSVLVARGSITQEKLEAFRQAAASGKPVQDISAFQVALAMLTITAGELGKKAIDPEVIRHYFWRSHDACIAWRAQTHKDFDPRECRVRPARILECGKNIIIETPEGRQEARESFCPVKKGDWVIVHYSSIIEKVSEKQARSLWKLKTTGASASSGFEASSRK